MNTLVRPTPRRLGADPTLLGAAGIVVLLYAPVVRALAAVWTVNGYYSYGFLIPVFSAYLVWEARAALLAAPVARRSAGLAVLAGGLGLLALGAAIDSLSLQALSLPVSVAGVAFWALGRERFGAVAFPIGFLVFMAPLPDGVIPAVSLPLQQLAAWFTEQACFVLGVPVVREGLLVHLVPVTLAITEACNGLRFLLAMIVLGVAFGWTIRAGLRDRVLLVLAGIGIAIVANLVRVAGTAVLADAYGPHAAEGLVHIAWGKVVYAVALVPFVALAMTMRRRARAAEPARHPAAPSGHDASAAAVAADAPPAHATSLVVPAAEPAGPRASAAPAARPTVSAIIPTKNRPAFLVEAVQTLLAQTVVPDELIVVDQSDTDRGRSAVEELFRRRHACRTRLTYLWDRGISGAAAARNAGIDIARGDVLVFCDDDVTPEPDAIERLLAHYRSAPEIDGVAPVITNYTDPGLPVRLHRLVFHRGPFRDERQPVYWRWRRYRGAARLPVRMFTGAMMSFRRSSLGSARHDARFRGPSVGEDIDLCWTLVARGARLAIATDARIVHHRAPRPSMRFEETLITSWGFLYDKHVPKTLAHRLAFAWYVVGIFVMAVVGATRERSLGPLRSAAAGVRGLFNDYAGSTFLAPATTARS